MEKVSLFVGGVAIALGGAALFGLVAHTWTPFLPQKGAGATGRDSIPLGKPVDFSRFADISQPTPGHYRPSPSPADSVPAALMPPFKETKLAELSPAPVMALASASSMVDVPRDSLAANESVVVAPPTPVKVPVVEPPREIVKVAEARPAELKVVTPRAPSPLPLRPVLPVEPRAKVQVAQAKPVEAKRVVAKPAPTKVADTRSAHLKPVAFKYVDHKVLEAKPAPAKAAEPKRVEQKRVVTPSAIATPVGRMAPKRITEAKAAEAKRAEARIAEAKAAEAKLAEAKRVADLRTAELKVAERERAAEAKLVEAKLAEAKVAEREHAAELKAVEAKLAEAQLATEMKAAQAKLAEAKLAEMKRVSEIKPAVETRRYTCNDCGKVTSVIARLGDRGKHNWEVRVDFGGASDRVFYFPTDPGLLSGDSVRYQGGRLVGVSSRPTSTL